ncbi:ribonuclease H-like domain-containing protein, partial [Tanacetum coccineum]
LPTSVLNGKFPYDLVYNKPLFVKHLRSFGSLAYATILNSHDKFGCRSEKFVFVGYSNYKKGYKLWSFDNKWIIYSRDDISAQDVNHLNFFNTNTLDDLPDIPNDEERRNPSPSRHGNSPSHSGSPSTSSNANYVGHFQDVDVSASENGSFSAHEENNNNSEGNDLHDQSHEEVSQANNDVQNLRRSSRTSVFSRNFNNFVFDSKVKHGLEKYVNYSYLSKGNYCFATMLNKGVEPKNYLDASQHKHWVDAMNAEMDALSRNNTWDIVDLLVGRKAIGSKWVWKIKYNYDGEIERYKARLVVKAPRKWNAKLTISLLENDFVQSKSDYSLFTKPVDNVFIALLVYVDDIIITGSSLAQIEKVTQFLKTKFMIKDLGKLKYFLGIEVLDTPSGVCLNQRKYYLELIDEFDLLAEKPSSLPMQPNISLTSEPNETDPLLENDTEYQKLIGKLIYLTTTRPHIAYTVSCLSHLKSALKVIRYLKGSAGLWFPGKAKNKPQFLNLIQKRRKKFTDIVRSAYYVAPEVLKRRSGPESDVWSIAHPWVRVNGNASLIPLDISVLSNMPHFALASTLDEEVISDLKDQFYVIDVVKSGAISLEEMRQALAKDIPWKMKESRVSEILQIDSVNTKFMSGLAASKSFVGSGLQMTLMLDLVLEQEK